LEEIGDGFGVNMSGKWLEGITGDLDGDGFPRGEDTLELPQLLWWSFIPATRQCPLMIYTSID